MKILKTVRELKDWRKLQGDQMIGFVPTMGALHQGHLSLALESQKHCDLTLVSVFVNPTQFNDPNDFENYPNDLQNDLDKLDLAKVNAVFLPNKENLYPDNYEYQVKENNFSKLLCGQFRPGHFDGVLTVVLKLLMAAKPTKVYMGEKDYQQLALIKGMVEAFFLDTEIVGCPTVRESDGLAMSSRNRRLTAADREKAPLLYKVIAKDIDPASAKAELTQGGFQVEYLEDVKSRRFVAAKLGEVRLIDNVPKT